jgi:tetratricopeptide (TPR) repeat protein
VQSVLESQLELLKGINASLEKQGQPVSLVSPLAGARYLLGTCYEHAGKKDAALMQFYNVYAKYGDSEWGPQAQERAQALKAEFETEGKTVKIDLGANLAKMEESRLRVARRLFFDKEYSDAVPAYLDALNEYPEGKEAVTALRELTLSYISLGDPLSVKTVAAYTGERFAARDAAADALLAVGKRALDTKQNDLAWWIYDRYFDFFPKNARAPAVLYSLASLRSGAEQEDYLNRILKNYPDSPYVVRALGRLAWNAYANKDYETAAARFEKVVNTETDPQKETRARFALAESYRVSNAWKNSLKNFQTLEKSLNKTTESYGVSDEALKFNRPFLEKSVFYQGVCLEKLGEPEKAVKAFDRFIETFQGSEFIPQTQLAKGSALMELKRYDDALAAFATFDAASGRKFLEPVLYYRGQAQFETGRYSEAIQSLETLLTSWPESSFYFDAKLEQGRAYAANGQNADAVRVLSDILNFATDDLLLNRASLELGRAQTDPSEKLASFQRVALLANPDDSAQAPLVAQALFESLPIYLELNRPQDLLTDSARLEKELPTFGKTDEINLLREQAKQKLEAMQKEEAEK